MLFKGLTIAVAAVLLLVAAPAQTDPAAADDAALRRQIQKQFLVNQTEGRLREIDLAAPRVFLRFKIAEWLWNEEPTYFRRAEDLAVAAIDDLYKNRSEIPPVYFSALSSGVFALIQRRSPRLSKTLEEKYAVNETERVGIQYELIRKAGSEKSAVDAAIRSLSSGSAYQLPVLLNVLKQRKSPEIFRLLDALVSIEERSPGRIDPIIFRAVSPYFADRNVGRGSAERFARIVVRRAQAASLAPFADFDSWLDVLNANSKMIVERFPSLASDIEVLRLVLNSRISQRSRAERERDERIEKSADKLDALVSEAEQAKDPAVRFDLFRRAVRAALERGLFVRSADLAVQFAAVDISSVPILSKSQKSEFGQMLEGITEKALTAGDPASARYAVERHDDDERKAGGYLGLLKFYVDNTDFETARETLKIALQSVEKVENPARRAILFLKMIATAQKLDPKLVFDINVPAARSINAIPSLEVEDKPGTERFENYVSEIMDVNWYLVPIIAEYAQKERIGAADLASRIEKKEIRIFADFVSGVVALSNDFRRVE